MDMGARIANSMTVTVKKERYFPTLERAGETIKTKLNNIRTIGISVGTWEFFIFSLRVHIINKMVPNLI